MAIWRCILSFEKLIKITKILQLQKTQSKNQSLTFVTKINNSMNILYEDMVKIETL